MKKSAKQVTALFMRVSTKDQKHDRQKTILGDWCRSQGLKSGAYRYYCEKVSGAKETASRSGLSALLRHVEQGQVHSVIVERLDRLSRSTRGGLEILQQLADAGVRIVAVKQSLDLSGAVGKFLSTLFLALAEWERTLLSERVSEGMETARRNGKHVGRPRNPKRYERAQKMRSDGMSAVQIADKLKIRRQSVYYLLNEGKRKAV